jgi:type II secretory pathway pseudopilin PulG
MINFFRKIRKKLSDDNMPLKYMRYAIGEIVLVVIGILIALSINNWNEYKKERKQERKVLTELLTSLENNFNRMISDSINRSNWNKSSDIVINSLEQGATYSDTLNKHFQNARKPGTNLSLSYAGYEGLKNIGYNIITSDTLRKNIVELFELTHKTLLEEMEYFESFQPDRQTYIDRLFSYEYYKFNPNDPFNLPLYPNNYTVLIQDSIYLPMIKSVTIQRNIISVLLHDNLKETQRMISLIKNELNELNQ